MQYLLSLIVLISLTACSESSKPGETLHPDHKTGTENQRSRTTFEDIIEEKEKANIDITTVTTPEVTQEIETEEEIIKIEKVAEREEEIEIAEEKPTVTPEVTQVETITQPSEDDKQEVQEVIKEEKQQASPQAEQQPQPQEPEVPVQKITFEGHAQYLNSAEERVTLGKLNGHQAIHTQYKTKSENRFIIKSEQLFTSSEEAHNFCKSVHQHFTLATPAAYMSFFRNYFSYENFKTKELSDFFQSIVFEMDEPKVSSEGGKIWDVEKIHLFHWASAKNQYYFYYLPDVIESLENIKISNLSHTSLEDTRNQIKDYQDQLDQNVLSKQKICINQQIIDGKANNVPLLSDENQECEVTPLFCPVSKMRKDHFTAGLEVKSLTDGDTCDEDYSAEEQKSFEKEYVKEHKRIVVEMMSQQGATQVHHTNLIMQEQGQPAYCVGSN